jgi:hypothetical protein
MIFLQESPMSSARHILHAAIAATVLACGSAQAGRGGVHVSGQVNLGHHYPAHGFVTGGLPRGSVNIAFRGGHHFYHRGAWYRPWGSRFIVGLPPFGIVVPLLPAAYATVWIGGAPYYYANGVYYAPAGYDGYTVVPPPPDADDALGRTHEPAPKPAPDPIIYPRNGQSAQQTEADRQDCNRWATTQPSAMADASVFHRAVQACMDGRGYSMK